jgi:putative aldouronate transport system substrate-binding protein
MKKIIALLLAALMLVSLVACTKAPAETTTKAPASTQGNEPAKDDTTAAAEQPKEAVTVKWVTIDSQPTNYDTWVAQVNAHTEPLIGVKVEVVYVDGDTRNLMYQTGADYDIMFGEGGNFNDMALAGAVAPLDEYLSEVPALMDLIPAYVFDAVKVDGKICGIPAYKDYSHSEYFIWEKAVVDEYYPDYEKVTNLQQLYDAVKAIKDAGCEWQSLYMAGGFSNGIPTWNYDTAEICGFVGINYQNGTEFVSIYESDEVKANIETIGKLYKEGYLNSDNYILDSAEMTEYVVGNGWGWPSAAETAWKRDGRDVVVSQYMYTTASTGSIRGSFLVLNPSSTKKVEALKFIELLNTNTYLRDLFWYGEEGLNWDYIDENGTTKVHRYGEADGVEGWTMAAYRQGSFFNVTPQEGSLGYKEIQTLNENAKGSPAMGFVFDKTEVEDIILDMNGIWAQYEKMIMCGVQPELLDEVIPMLYDAGLQTVIDEANKQFKAWKGQ